VLEAVLARLADVNPLINAVVTLDEGAARLAALESSRRHRDRRARGPLDGVPITVKDNIKVKGLRATWGSAVYASHVPDEDELPIARLRAAGVVIVGKTNCPEFTLQGYTSNALFGTTRNPWDPSLTPGGSSGGAVAAVSAGIGPIAIGTDGGGSIRRPASHTGLIGLKPSRGCVPRRNGFPPILFDYETVGPIARSVADIEMVMTEISRADGPGLTNPAVAPRRSPARPASARILYVPRLGRAPVDARILAAVESAVATLRGLGHTVDEEAVPFDIDRVNAAWPVISQSGLAWLAGTLADFDSLAAQAIRDIASSGARHTASQYVGALMAIRDLQSDLSRVFASYDFLLTPSAAALPWPVEQAFPAEIAGQPVDGRGHAVYTAFVNLSGCGGINVPCGYDERGLPIGMQFVAAPGRDGELIAIAAQCEQVALWESVRPTDVPGIARLQAAR
jgi:aspartyl-tRNA(Asn)/glutamyl-tRNA(Gln) amidotransferase subunit A